MKQRQEDEESEAVRATEEGISQIIEPEDDDDLDPDLSKHLNEQAESVKRIAAGRSACCNAPIDMSRVIKEGRHKGHGARICSQCRRVTMFI